MVALWGLMLWLKGSRATSLYEYVNFLYFFFFTILYILHGWSCAPICFILCIWNILPNNYICKTKLESSKLQVMFHKLQMYSTQLNQANLMSYLCSLIVDEVQFENLDIKKFGCGQFPIYNFSFSGLINHNLLHQKQLELVQIRGSIYQPPCCNLWKTGSQ